MLKSDTAVPIGQAPIYVANVNEKINAILPNVNCAPFGHLGDGNIHFNVARGDGMTKANFIALWPQLKKIIEDEAIKLGGTISAEHGIGALKLDKYNEIANPNEKKIMHGLSNLFNPNSIMNPNI